MNASTAPRTWSSAARRAVGSEVATIGYNVVEAIVAVTAGLVAGSVALTAFGVDFRQHSRTEPSAHRNSPSLPRERPPAAC